MLSINEQFKLVGLSLGIFASYSIMALYQEKIFKNDYEGEKFVYPTTFVALQCLVYFVTAKGELYFKKLFLFVILIIKQ